MTARCNLGILDEIQALVADKLQVVSYKWLSHNFSLSSNSAKRLLQEFIQRYNNGFEVIYCVSGWLKTSPQVYHVRLVPGFRLADVKTQFKDDCSVQVYSVQACTPKDPAALWNAEFVQTEELFNQPLDVNNCLRDNRFCGVLNPFVKRDLDGKLVALLQDGKHGVLSRASDFFQSAQPQEAQPRQTSWNSQSCAAAATDDKPENRTSVHSSKPQAGLDHTKKIQGEKSSSAGGSLASLWDRASSKSNAVSPSKEICVPVPVDADVPACNDEAAAGGDSSDEENIAVNFRRIPNGDTTRKKRVFFDFSDEEDEKENVVSLSSPEPLNTEILAERKANSPLGNEDAHTSYQKHEKYAKPEKLESTSEMSVDGSFEGSSMTKKAKIPLPEKGQSSVTEGLNDENARGNVASVSFISPKRRKVLKTRIDEKGREVNEVIWEGEDINAGDVAVRQPSSTANRPPAVSKAPSSKNAASFNSTSKNGNKKSGQTGAKDTKQGNILSFFKKV